MSKMNQIEQKLQAKTTKKETLLERRDKLTAEIQELEKEIHFLETERFQALCIEHNLSFEELKELLGGNSHV
ncbi:TPA: hypothetical protein TXJ06_002134 [Streptococcus suis]|nr:hypothetical protein [Streptococcus suis]MCQ8264793.1 hypothetical protein [Streptococcus suis]HEL1585351.1 hypothetical protein [Streptococcus suis]